MGFAPADDSVSEGGEGRERETERERERDREKCAIILGTRFYHASEQRQSRDSMSSMQHDSVLFFELESRKSLGLSIVFLLACFSGLFLMR